MRELALDLSGNLMTIDKNALELMIEKGQTEIANAKHTNSFCRLESLVEAVQTRADHRHPEKISD